MPQIFATEVIREQDLNTKAFTAREGGRISIDTDQVQLFREETIRTAEGTFSATRVVFKDASMNGGSYIQRGENGPEKKVYTGVFVTEGIDELTGRINDVKAAVSAGAEALLAERAAAAPAPRNGRNRGPKAET